MNEPAEYEMMIPRLASDEKSSHMDPNHSHFILIDSVKQNEYGGEIALRSRLESEISKRGSSPIVVLVLGGGRNTVEQVRESVKNNLACIFFDDTGKFSNVFACIQKKLDKKETIFDKPIDAIKDGSYFFTRNFLFFNEKKRKNCRK